MRSMDAVAPAVHAPHAKYGGRTHEDGARLTSFNVEALAAGVSTPGTRCFCLGGHPRSRPGDHRDSVGRMHDRASPFHRPRDAGTANMPW
jgi:hypothetical protein